MIKVSSPSSCAILRVAVGGLAVLFLSGCAEMNMAYTKRTLDVQTKMSESVFLDPVAPDKKVMFVEVRNTSDKDNFDLETPIKAAMTKRGYRVTQNPDEAHYRLQINVLNVSKTDPEGASAALSGGYGGPVAAATLVGTRKTNDAASMMAGAFMKDVVYMVVTDVQLVEKAAAGVIVRQDSQQNLKQGMGGGLQQTTSEATKFKKYRVRVVGTANKANLEYEEAAPALTEGLTRSLSGLF